MFRTLFTLAQRSAARIPIAGIAFATLVPVLSVTAELQQVDVGGSLQIYGHYYTDFYENNDPTRIAPGPLVGRPIGSIARDPLTRALVSGIRTFDGDGSEGVAWVEQRTALHLNARFTDEVSAFIEFDSISEWGTDFRSNTITGIDTTGNSDVNLYQAYIEANAMWGLPIRLRLGRQELLLGNEWLVGNNYWYNPLTNLSFDGIRLTYGTGPFTVDAFGMKLNENLKGFADGDAELYGLYGSYTGLEDVTLDLYWLLLRDGADIEDVQGTLFVETVESLLGVDDYDTTTIHTIGLRAAAAWGGIDLEGEIAYQFGDASAIGATFAPVIYGDNNASYSTWAGNITLGYTFDSAWNPRVYVGGEYYGGEDNRDRSLFDMLNPFDKPDASVSFNRLFTSWEADWFLDANNLSNVWILKAGVSANPTEKIEVGLDALYFETVDTFRSPVLGRFGASRMPVYALTPWGGKESDPDLGTETVLWMAYAYSDDLLFEAGWAHFFTGDGLEDGNFVNLNGLGFYGGLDNDDGDYFYMGSTITF